MLWNDLTDLIAGESKIQQGRHPEGGYARIEIDLGAAEYVGTDIPLAFSGEQIAKIKYTGSGTGTYFRLHDRQAHLIYPTEFKRSNISFTKIFLTNPVAQPGKVFSFYIGTGIFAAIQPGGIGAGSELVGLTDAAGTTINPATEDTQDDIKTMQSVDGNGDLRKIKEELEKIHLGAPRQWDVSAARYLHNFSVAGQEASANGVFFKPDGTKMYVIGATGKDVNEYDLGTPWDVASAVYLQLFDVSTQETLPSGLFFKPDGTKLYVVGTSGDEVNEYDLSTAWDVSTAVYLQLFSVAGEETNPQGLFFNPDGTKMYVIGSTGDDVNEYDLGTGWDVTTAVYLQLFDVSGEDDNPRDIFFTPDGTKMYVVGNTGNDINEYDLSTAWDVTTAVFLQNFSVASEDVTPTGVFFKPDGTKMYVVGEAGDDINEYDLRITGDFSGNVFNLTLKVADVTDDAKHPFFTNEKKLRDVVITNTHASENIVIGEDQADVATLRLEGYILKFGTSISFTQIDLATLYYVTEVNAEEPTLRLIGVEM